MAKKQPKRPGRGSEQFVLRLPDGMRDKLHELANANDRSVNAEIVNRLEKSMEHGGPFQQLQERVEYLEERLENLEHEFKHRYDDPNPDD
ncbi:MAG TPA: Arc family DNA-binding protein [Bradyrhizobium sp.]|uniref:Arc family DNA-binding protein n=1 Tax=Bradyrhizobium sp. TaxID=376 RepID=UPI002C3D7A9C|nr:Arc family DNA-binding protein [Bradyrhizobium sp.]HTA99374.1 Arc family DNA-binding protein [Bradyrhizobium sp.]